MWNCVYQRVPKIQITKLLKKMLVVVLPGKVQRLCYQGAVEQKTLSKIQVFGAEDWREVIVESDDDVSLN